MAGNWFNQQQFNNNRDRLRRGASFVGIEALNQLAELVAAIRFLTIIPIPGLRRLFSSQSTQPSTPSFGLGSGYFPLVGLLLALLLSILVVALRTLVPPLALSALLVVVLVILTGGIHLDGLMDSCDGLFGGATPERRLEIMKDSRVGSFGVLGGVSALLLKFAFLASLQGSLLIPALLITLTTSRWTMTLALSIFPNARSTGLGVTFRQIITRGRLLLAGIVALIVAVVFGYLVGLAVFVVVTIVAISAGVWIARRLDGLTGDTYGAIEELAEVIALLLLVILPRWF
jgi:adenosylcobinamide-GDP ribazoletransferase